MAAALPWRRGVWRRARLLVVPALAALALPAGAALSADRDFRLEFRLGESVFQRLWVPAPASARSADGLGPLYNARACESCHPRAGRGPSPPGTGEAPAGLVARLSIPAATPPQRALLEEGRLGLIPDPRYGAQLQPLSAPGLPGEGRLAPRWQEHRVTMADGLVVALRQPRPRLEEPGHGPPDPGLRLSLRLSPPLLGLGLLEQVPEAEILAAADPQDRDGDGIRGRPNRVAGGRLGRFGWKATEPDLPEQAAAAFALDLGLSTPPRPDPWGDCTPAQPACRQAPHGGAAPHQPEVAPALFALTVFYARNLAPPPRRAVEAPGVRQGEALFGALGCAACHRPRLATAGGAPIAPYTDLLLHDMGEGLADGHAEWQAGGQDWRTAPLWGLGLATARPGGAGLLHDGRARSALEAILWHGGEALQARDRVLGLRAEDRAALLTFLDSL
ncbi:di-heme oxidoredictase family protein [Teichococcus aestuarii]|uniref:di-heme oxidoredictase family protein n=1 Tax=Teichococcus aestuarii TaxID=568898 RepID=UPI00361C6594